MKNNMRKAAILSGSSLLIMAVAAGFSYGYVLSAIPADYTQVPAYIKANDGLRWSKVKLRPKIEQASACNVKLISYHKSMPMGNGRISFAT